MNYKTASDVLRLCHISKPTLYKICREKGIKVKRTIGGNYRFSDSNIKQILEGNVDIQSPERRFVNTISDILDILTEMAKEIWGEDKGEQKLKEIINKNKNELFVLNASEFK